jgi:hypothetical protein
MKPTKEQMTDEEYVRSKWEAVEVEQDCYADWYYSLGGIYDSTQHFSTEEETWSAAAEFTRQREEEIRQVEAEVAMARKLFMESAVFDTNSSETAIFDRIFAREQQALADLKRGWREVNEAKKEKA